VAAFSKMINSLSGIDSAMWQSEEGQAKTASGTV
jgi:hypothetical protein